MRRLRGILALAVVAVLGGSAAVITETALPNRPDTFKFAVLGDNGTGDRAQYEVGQQMAELRRTFAFDLVIMLGDNFYGSQRPADLVRKFDLPYRELLARGVRFHAALGNHDELHTIHYSPLNMNGQRYYTFARQDVRFVVLDTNSMDQVQIAWADRVLGEAREAWKICYFHHPLYSNAGRHGSAVELRVLLEPILLRHGVQVVFSGHDHAYERLLPQKGIHYFVSGAGGKLRQGDIRPSPTTAARFDRDQSFMLVEVDGEELFFQAVSRVGQVVDSGTIRRAVARIGT